MKVAFYLNNQNYKDVNFSHPENGNPGLRGTQYMIWMIACLLSRTYVDIDVILYANFVETMPKDVKSKYCVNEVMAIKQSEIDNIDILVLRTSISTEKNVFERLKRSRIKCITWSHNFEDYYLAEMIANTEAIKRNVCVGRQQYERLRDHKVFYKSTYIYNALSFDCYKKEKNRKNNEHIVTFVGMLDSSKGFHRLAKIWPKVVEKDGHAVLYVLGAGNLGSNSKLGSLGIADEKYEQRISKYICDKCGNIIPSIKFMGKVGGEYQRELMAASSVGIANPTGIGETFCIVAVEFEALGIPVVSSKKYGLLDTVCDGKDGFLSNTDKGLINKIVRLLNDEHLNSKMGEYGYKKSREKFSFPLIIEEWYKLLTDVYNDVSVIPNYNFNYPFNQLKILREINRIIKKVPLFEQMPSFLEYEYRLRKIAKKVRKVILERK